jgi:hypothetical protein
LRKTALLLRAVPRTRDETFIAETKFRLRKLRRRLRR